MKITLSPKFQIVIPKEIRTVLKWKAGMKLQVSMFSGRVEIVPTVTLKKLRGAYPNLNTENIREKTDRKY
mgnify:CR=1 FL=1